LKSTLGVSSLDAGGNRNIRQHHRSEANY